jgi:hypothetical protein
MAAVFYEKGISDVFIPLILDRGVEVYILLFSHPSFCKNYRTIIKSVEIEKSLENKAF